MYRKNVLGIKLQEVKECFHGPKVIISTRNGDNLECAAFRDKNECNKSVSRMKSVMQTKKNQSILTKKVKKLVKNQKLNSRPTELIEPLEDNKKNAQYFFSNDMMQYFINTILEHGYTKVICIGAPRIHENLQLQKKQINSYLLDIDERFMHYFPPDQFSLFNMFNNHFIYPEQEEYFKEFIKSQSKLTANKVLLFIDPPFGGLLQLLCGTLDRITNRIHNISGQCTVDTMLILPYYLGKKLIEFKPELNMLDYRVTYENHSRLDGDGGGNNSATQSSRRESVVRIFTNISPLSSIKPPLYSLYKLCSICDRFSHLHNPHCHKCGGCTTRHGQKPYRHCKQCGKCHQQNKVFCSKCKLCLTKEHECQGAIKKKKK